MRCVWCGRPSPQGRNKVRACRIQNDTFLMWTCDQNHFTLLRASAAVADT